MDKNAELLKKIAWSMCGLDEVDLTSPERMIVRLLIEAGYLKFEGEFDTVTRNFPLTNE